MLNKIAAIGITGVVLTACGSTEPVGGRGYFDGPAPVQQTTSTPLQITPDVQNTDTTTALTTAVETALADTSTTTPTPVAPVNPNTISTDDGSLNLNLSTLDEQIVARNADAARLAQARAQLVIIEPGALPNIVAGVNIALYARETTNAVGQKLYNRPVIKTRFSKTECRKFRNPDDAQRYFLANDGPQKDPLNLDPDGDGFACKWSPENYRRLQ